MQSVTKRIPERKCCGCGLVKPCREMFRIVRTPEGAVLIDETGRMNGRGAYICRDRDCIARAEKKNSIGRSLKTEAGRELYEDLKTRCGRD